MSASPSPSPSPAVCPVDHTKYIKPPPYVAAPAAAIAAPAAAGCDSDAMAAAPAVCPVSHDARRVFAGSSPSSSSSSSSVSVASQVGDEFPAARGAGSLSPGQRAALPSEGAQSTIPKGGALADPNETWAYPSQQRFYDAMKKKGHH